MNAAQTKKVRRLTNNLDRLTRYSDYREMNGVMVFTVESDAKGNVVLVAKNEEISWYMTRFYLFAVVGPRGGLKVYVNENVPSYIIH